MNSAYKYIIALKLCGFVLTASDMSQDGWLKVENEEHRIVLDSSVNELKILQGSVFHKINGNLPTVHEDQDTDEIIGGNLLLGSTTYTLSDSQFFKVFNYATSTFVLYQAQTFSKDGQTLAYQPEEICTKPITDISIVDVELKPIDSESKIQTAVILANVSIKLDEKTTFHFYNQYGAFPNQKYSTDVLETSYDQLYYSNEIKRLVFSRGEKRERYPLFLTLSETQAVVKLYDLESNEILKQTDPMLLKHKLLNQNGEEPTNPSEQGAIAIKECEYNLDKITKKGILQLLNS